MEQMDVLEDVNSILLVDDDLSDAYSRQEADGFTELARAKIIVLKNDLALFSSAYTKQRTQLQEQALELVHNEQTLQFWCDLAQLDYNATKQWLLTPRYKVVRRPRNLS